MYTTRTMSAAEPLRRLVAALTGGRGSGRRGRLHRRVLCALASSAIAVSPALTLHVAHASSGLAWNTGITTGPATLSRPAVTVGQDGNVYVFGGTLGDNTDYNTTFIYQPTTNSWSLGAAMPVAREGAQAVTLPDGRIAVLGGGTQCMLSELCSNGTVYNRIDVYTPSTNAWSTLAPMQSPRYRFAAVLYHGQIYAIGGSDGTQALASVEAYDPISDTWSTVASLPQPSEASSAVVDGDDHIDVIGGFDGIYYSDTYDSFLIYDGQTWTSGPALLQPTEDSSATLGSDGQIYVIGGFDQQSLEWLTTVQVYNPAQHAWSFGSPLPSPTCCSGTVTVPGGQIYVVNGGVSAGAQFAIYGPSIVLAPAAGAPGSTAALTGTNFAPAATVSLFWGAASDGHLLATGATDSSGATTTPISFTVPATATPGTYTLTARDDQSQYPVTTTFVVPPAQPTIAALSTASGGDGQAVSATGSAFGPREAVGLYWDRFTSPLTATVSTASGAFHTAFRVPPTTAGVHYLLALGWRSHRLSSRRFIVRPRTFLAKPTAAPGTPNALVALGFPANDTVQVYWRSPGGTLLGTLTTNAAGAGTLSFTTPTGTAATYNVISLGQAVGGLSTLTLTS